MSLEDIVLNENFELSEKKIDDNINDILKPFNKLLHAVYRCISKQDKFININIKKKEDERAFICNNLYIVYNLNYGDSIDSLIETRKAYRYNISEKDCLIIKKIGIRKFKYVFSFVYDNWFPDKNPCYLNREKDISFLQSEEYNNLLVSLAIMLQEEYSNVKNLISVEQEEIDQQVKVLDKIKEESIIFRKAVEELNI